MEQTATTAKFFAKQPIFNNSKTKGESRRACICVRDGRQVADRVILAVFSGGKKVNSKTKRWYKDVGLGFKTPAEAINGTYIDKKCPFTGDVSIRGRILSGVVRSTKMTNTIIIRRDYLHLYVEPGEAWVLEAG
jgi:hypothetical protein